MREAGVQGFGEPEKLPAVRSFEDLLVWKQGMALTREIYKLTKLLPQEERYGLISQLCRAALSVPLNIAEGHTRDSRKEYLYFLSISAGSLAEIKTLLILCVDLEYLSTEQVAPTQDLADKTLKMVRNLQRKLKTPVPRTPEPLILKEET